MSILVSNVRVVCVAMVSSPPVAFLGIGAGSSTHHAGPCTSGSHVRTAAATACTSVRRLWLPGTCTTVRFAAAGGIPKGSLAPCTTSVGTVTASSSGRRLGGTAPPERRGGCKGNARHSTATAPVFRAVRHATRAPADRPPTSSGNPSSTPARRSSTTASHATSSRRAGAGERRPATRYGCSTSTTLILSARATPVTATRSGAVTPPPAPWPRTSAALDSSAPCRWARARPCGVSISNVFPPAIRARRPPGRSRRCGSGHADAGKVVLDKEHVLGAGALDHGEQGAHARNLLALLGQEPAEELLADVLVLLTGELNEPGDLLGHRPLLTQRDRDRRALVLEARRRLCDARNLDLGSGVEQVLHDHHRVVSLLDCLPVEVSRKLRQRLRVVVDRDRDVLLRCGELARDLLVQRLGERAHRSPSSSL